MPTLDSFDPTLNLRILAQGPPGSGKTTLAAQFPSPAIVDCDNNLGGPARWLRINNLPQLSRVKYETVNVTPDGKEVPPELRYKRFVEITKRFAADPEVKTIIHDSATYISDYICDDIMRQNGIKAMRIQDWGAYLQAWKQLVTQMGTLPDKTYILTAHERPEKDDVEGIIKYFIALPGQIATIIGGLFSDVWHFENVENLGQHKNMIRTMPNARLILKKSVPAMPATMEAKWSELEKYIGFMKDKGNFDLSPQAIASVPMPTMADAGIVKDILKKI